VPTGRKAFIFEKKKQKTFAGWLRPRPGRLSPKSQSFLVLFLKRTASFSRLPHGRPALKTLPVLERNVHVLHQ
jgi:hypothetical protein